MSISASLNNALSGLTVSARAAQLVSNNVANAMTEGYGRRELSLASRELGGAGAGVRVGGITRAVDPGILRDRRLSDADLAMNSARAAFYATMGRTLGNADDPFSLAGREAALESSLISAASRPDLPARLDAVLGSAQSLAAGFREASAAVQTQRMDADASIARQVEQLNFGLRQIQDLNASISRLNGSGRDVTALEDQRQQVIDSISSIVPLREVAREDGKVSIYTQGGAVLLDHTAREVGFSPSATISADMTRESGALSGLTLDGWPARMEGGFAPFAGGSLAAAFDIRDRLAPQFQADLDAAARDLVQRFEDPALDPTLAAGDAGLFTDAGNPFAAADEVGLAARLAINPRVDPAAGGALFRLRDGMMATTPGQTGDARLLQGLQDALTMPRIVASGSSFGTSHSFATLTADLTARAASEHAAAERDQSFASARQSSLRQLEAAGGVDTDQEMQKLLLIEQSYAANARVIQTIDELIEQLMRL